MVVSGKFHIDCKNIFHKTKTKQTKWNHRCSLYLKSTKQTLVLHFWMFTIHRSKISEFATDGRLRPKAGDSPSSPWKVLESCDDEKATDVVLQGYKLINLKDGTWETCGLNPELLLIAPPAPLRPVNEKTRPLGRGGLEIMVMQCIKQ